MADEYKVAVQQQGRQQQMQMQQGGMPRTPAAAAASPSRTDPAGLQRLTAALTAVLSSGMASDYVEGLKPVLHNGKLAISTYIKLDQDPEPVFIGMFNSLPAAVQAQKQSTELVRQGGGLGEARWSRQRPGPRQLHWQLPSPYRSLSCSMGCVLSIPASLCLSPVNPSLPCRVPCHAAPCRLATCLQVLLAS